MHGLALRMLLIGAFLTLAAAAVIALGVIPRVRADTFPGATPDRAVVGFWVNVILAVLTAAAALVSTRLGASRPTMRRVLPGVAGLVALLLGLALMDAAAAYSGHGPGMHGATVALWACVCLDLAGGALMVVAALIRRRG
jgi:hypothetical protein